jgi:hypothetical protein
MECQGAEAEGILLRLQHISLLYNPVCLQQLLSMREKRLVLERRVMCIQELIVFRHWTLAKHKFNELFLHKTIHIILVEALRIVVHDRIQPWLLISEFDFLLNLWVAIGQILHFIAAWHLVEVEVPAFLGQQFRRNNLAIVKVMADGGEGTVDALLSACEGDRIHVPVTGPYGDKIISYYGKLHTGINESICCD